MLIVNYPIPVGPTSVSPTFITVSSRDRSYFFNWAQFGFYQEMFKNILTDLTDTIVVRAANVYAVPCQAMPNWNWNPQPRPQGILLDDFSKWQIDRESSPDDPQFWKTVERGRGCWNPTMSSEARKDFSLPPEELSYMNKTNILKQELLLNVISFAKTLQLNCICYLRLSKLREEFDPTKYDNINTVTSFRFA